MRKTSLAKRGDKRHEILNAAMTTFLRAGLQGASISAICTEAGISPGHLYHYFESKEAIVEAISEAYLAEVQEHFGKLSENKTLMSVIVAAIERAVGTSRHRNHALFFETMAEATRNPKIAEIVQAANKLTRALLVDLIRNAQERGEVDAGIEPESAAPIIVGVIDAAKIMYTRDPDFDVAKRVQSLSVMIAALLCNTGARS